MNKVILIGRMTRDIEVRYTQSNTPVGQFSIAIDNGKKGEYKIVYICNKCGAIKKNKMAKDDNMDLIIQIMSNPKNF